MNFHLRARSFLGGFLVLAPLLTSCTSPAGKSTTNPAHPGPAVGQAAGNVVGVVGGNVVGAAVGAVEGTVSGAQKPFTNEPRTIRTWRTETTSDGRTIQVPHDTSVDAYGRPITINK
ncbi:MAG: flagellar motor protein MotB [Opitutus sp.]|nr:flagellar motor protein MotB [Opitutus sp.]MCS6248255.1 flagellar motor protein MotB [Opitutus sp.]MCS6274869.1 flagellar motor protein MotB [Opitutus sp.]MCS6276474.1 flagellar motor protein MotB [Opitutus sp.]MCS6301878.1 flagellar motor protein MotB [Opitutus sp.]